MAISKQRPTLAWPLSPGWQSKEKSSALKKATQVLELVIAQDFGISAAELALRLKLPRQTVHRTVRALEEMGFLIRTIARDKYEIGPTLAKLANSILMLSYRRGPWRSVLQHVVEKAGESCNVAVLDGYEIVYIDRIECPAPLRVQLDIGSRVPAYCTAIGKVLLAYLPPAARKRLLDNLTVKRLTKNTIIDRKRIDVDLQKVRKQGYAVNDEEFIRGIAAIAVPVFDEHDQVIAGIAIHLPVLRAPVGGITRFLPILRKAAKQLAALHHPNSRRAVAAAPVRRRLTVRA